MEDKIMSITWEPGISTNGAERKTLLSPIFEDGAEIIRKAGNGNFTSYYLPSHSIMRPSIMRLQNNTDAKLYEGSPIQVMYQLPDKGRRTLTLKVIDNSKLTCDGADECKFAVANTEVAIEVKFPTYDVSSDEDQINAYIDLLLGTIRKLVGLKEIEESGGTTYELTNWARLLKGSTSIEDAD
jgi:hypothetical protein